MSIPFTKIIRKFHKSFSPFAVRCSAADVTGCRTKKAAGIVPAVVYHHTEKRSVVYAGSGHAFSLTFVSVSSTMARRVCICVNTMSR